MNPALPKKLNQRVKITNVTKGMVIADKAKMASTFLDRLVGLLSRSSLNQGEALILKPSNCIHSFFMRFAIDVIFLDKDSRIIKTIAPLKTWRLTGLYFNSASVIELPSGIIQSTQTQKGDVISVL